MKNPVTPAGIEQATFRFVAQHLKHCATAVTRIVTRQAIYMSMQDRDAFLQPLLQWKSNKYYI